MMTPPYIPSADEPSGEFFGKIEDGSPLGRFIAFLSRVFGD